MKCADDQMTLGSLIEFLLRAGKEDSVYFDFAHFRPNATIMSYRGFYEDLALGYDSRYACTAGQLLTVLRGSVGAEFEAYKGGVYVATSETALWVANYGESGSTAIVGATYSSSVVTIHTRHVEI